MALSSHRNTCMASYFSHKCEMEMSPSPVGRVINCSRLRPEFVIPWA